MSLLLPSFLHADEIINRFSGVVDHRIDNGPIDRYVDDYRE